MSQITWSFLPSCFSLIWRHVINRNFLLLSNSRERSCVYSDMNTKEVSQWPVRFSSGLFNCAFVFPHVCNLSSVFLLAHQDFAYHGIAAFFYLSASVALAKVTLDMKDGSSFQNYQLDISAVVSHHPVPTNQPNKRDLNLTQSPLIGSEVVVSKPSLVLDQH